MLTLLNTIYHPERIVKIKKQYISILYSVQRKIENFNISGIVCLSIVEPTSFLVHDNLVILILC